jgi:hypothetical protein
MIYQWLADLTVVVHLAFVGFVVAGGLLVARWGRVAWIHLPSVLWGIGVEWAGGVCPLTPLEVWLRRRAGRAGYEGGFIEHYLLPVLYPAELTRGVQWTLGALLLGLNLVVYGMLLRRASSRGGGDGRTPDRR